MGRTYQHHNFNYLGSTITDNGENDIEISKRKYLRKTDLTKLTSVEEQSDKNKHKAELGILTRVLHISVGVESQTLRAKEKNMIDIFEMWH